MVSSTMEWERGEAIGFGSFSTVNLAILKKDKSLLAVKSCEACDSSLLKNEEEVLKQLGDCPQIIKCLGDDQTVEKNQRLYNLFLEYAAGGSLATQVKNSGGFLQESEAKTYTRSVLKGLHYIHSKGYVHCDIKLQNILKFGEGEVKIADFGLAKKTGEKFDRIEVRGTPLYMAPESVNENEYDPPCDIWALGCALVEMVTGKPPWETKAGINIAALLIKIGMSDKLPKFPDELSNEGKDFLSKCFVKDPEKRWTAEMLLDHPFVANDNDGDFDDDHDDGTVLLKDSEELSIWSSPRGPFDFPDWYSVHSSIKSEEFRFDSLVLGSASVRIKQLVSDDVCNWSDSGDWVTVR